MKHIKTTRTILLGFIFVSNQIFASFNNFKDSSDTSTEETSPTVRSPASRSSTYSYKNETILPAAFATASAQGMRPSMEDAHFPMKPGLEEISPNVYFYGIYDGHCGPNAAKFCARHLHHFILNSGYFTLNIEKALHKGFIDTHTGYNHYSKSGTPTDGTTAIVVLIKDKILYTANAGDARAVLSVNGQALRLSEDHKPNTPNEIKRIQSLLKKTEIANRFPQPRGTLKSWPIYTCFHSNNSLPIAIECTNETGSILPGVYITKEIPDSLEISRLGIYRNTMIQGLSLSRAIGDYQFNPLITPEPFISKYSLTGDEEFILLACDGFWDVITDTTAVNLINFYLKHKKPSLNELPQLAQIIADTLVSLAINPQRLGSTDNVTVTIILFPKVAYQKSLSMRSFSIET